MSQCVQQKASKCPSLTSSFLWLLRDMDLTIGSISPTEWLLKKLQAPRCKEIINALTSSFSSIECIFLPRPSMKSDVLQDIVQRRDELSPQFNDQLERSKNALFSKIQPKKCKDGLFTGFSLASLLKRCVADINSSQSQLPNLEATWKTAVDVELQLYANNIVADYEKEMSLALKEVLPMEEGLADSSDTTTLMGIHNQFITRKVSALENKLLSLVPIKDVRDDFWKTIYADFISRIVEKEADGKIVGGVLATFLHENRRLSSELCLKTYATFYDQIVASRLRGYIAEGIPYDITEDIQRFKEQYNKVACGPAKAEVFSTKRQECMAEENKLLQIPGPIEDLQIIGIGSDCIKLMWQKPSINTTAAHAFEVYMVEEQGNLVLIDTTTNCYMLIKHLKSNQPYTFVVRAKNDHFCGNHVSHALARTSMNAISRTAFGVGTFFAFAVGSPVVFPTILTAGTIASIRSDINEQRYGTAVAKSASLTLLPLMLPLGAFATTMVAPIIASDAYSESGPKGDTSEDAPTV